jgi:transaldolase
MTTAIHRLLDLGQSTWLDYLDRRLLSSGRFDQLISAGGVRGVTSNPTIFEKAISGSKDYDAFFETASREESDAQVLERLMVEDLRVACDRLRPVYEAARGADGFASIEVAPGLAGDTSGSIDAAGRLWRLVDRPNLMVKIPGTPAGVPAIERCLEAGININITLLFSVERYLEVAEAYMSALESRLADRKPIEHLASVASFFVSRIDAKIDPKLDAMPNALRGAAGHLRGRIAIANAKRAFAEYRRILGSKRWAELAARGARPQRLLWASTSPKDRSYDEVYYVEALIGAGTIDTMTPECLRAYIDHGKPEARIESGTDLSQKELVALQELSVDLPSVLAELEREGVRKFEESYEKALASIAEKRRAGRQAGVSAPMHARTSK